MSSKKTEPVSVSKKGASDIGVDIFRGTKEAILLLFVLMTYTKKCIRLYAIKQF